MNWPALRRQSAEQRLDQELRDHLERQVEAYRASGMSEADSRRRVRLDARQMEPAKEACRDVRPLQWVDEFVRDVRLGFRGLRRDRLFATSLTLILALGIGMSVTMFSVLNAVVLRPLPYADPDQLVQVGTHLMRQNQFDGTAMANFLDWRRDSRSFAAMTVYRRTSASSTIFAGADAPERAQEGLVGAEFFDVVGALPLIGRTFSREEFDRRERLVVLSEGLWRQQFGGATSALGQSLAIGGENHVVIGVMPRTFQLPASDTRFWRPLSLIPNWAETQSVRDGDQFEVLGRLGRDVRIGDARAEMTLIAARLREAHEENRNVDIRITSLFDVVVGSQTRRTVWLGFAAVLSLLIIAGFNVGGLLLARATLRRRELAVRSALGAGRARLIRQLLAESVSLWAVASVVSLLLAYAANRLLIAYAPAMLPRMDELRMDAAALVVTFVGGFVVVVACGTIPALLAAKTNIGAAFAARDSSNLPRHRLQDILVIGQMAGALTLLIGAVLFAQSFFRAEREDVGYPADNLLIVRLDLPSPRYSDRARRVMLFNTARDRLKQLPGVVDVAGITDFFLRRNADQWVTIDGANAGRSDARLAIEGVTPGFFIGMGIDLIEGRDFDQSDYEPTASNVFIVSQSLARRFWPGESAVGKRIVAGSTPPRDGRWSTVVGVAKDMRREGLDVAPILLGFTPAYPRVMDVTIRVAGQSDQLMQSVRDQLHGIDRTLPMATVVSANGRLSDRIGGRRFESQVLGVFAALALVLSSAGLYASLAYQVALRTREIGIRSALGARQQSIIRMVVGQGARLALAGGAIGLAIAAAMSGVIQSLLYQTVAVSPPSYAAAVIFLLTIAIVAAWLPARRAAMVSPMAALREE